MRKSRTHLPQDSIYPFKGLNTRDPSTLLDPRFSPSLLNTFSDNGVITKRNGYVTLGQVLGSSIKALATYESDNLLMSFAITTNYQYRYDTDSSKWLDCLNALLQNCDDKDDWTAAGEVTLTDGATTYAGQLKATMSEAFTTGEICKLTAEIAVDLSGSNCLALRITPSIDIANEKLGVRVFSVSGGGSYEECKLPALDKDVENIIHIANDFSAVDTAYNVQLWAYEDLGAFNFYINTIGTCIKWSSTDDAAWVDTVEGLDNNGQYLFITNNFDRTLYWDGDYMQLYVPTSGLDDFATCRTMEIYLGSLMLGNITLPTVDTRYPNTVAYSTPGDFFDFSSTTADIVLLDTTKGGIEQIKLLGDAVVIYSVNSIGLARFIEGANRYVFDQIISGETRLLSGRGVINFGPYHALIMQDNIYLFNGTKALIPITKDIQPSYEKSIELEQLDTAFAFNDTFQKRAYFVLPVKATVEADRNVVMYVVEYGDFTLSQLNWSIQAFNTIPKCIGFLSEDKTLVWDNMTMFWLAPSISGMKWIDGFASPGFPFVVFGDATRVYKLTSDTYYDNAVVVGGEWQSLDFAVPEHYQSMNGRWSEVELELSGEEVGVYYSVDKGLSWIIIDAALSLTDNRTTYKLFFDVVSRHVRIKISSSSYFSLYWLRLWLSRGGI